MKSISIAAIRMPVPVHGFPPKLVIAAGLTALADWLFYDHRIGLSLALFLFALTAASLLTSRVRTGGRQALIAAALLIAGLMPILEELNILSALFGVLAVTAVLSLQTNPFTGGLTDHARAIGGLLLLGPFRLMSDVMRSPIWSWSPSSLTAWIVPLVLSAIFISLFASANPLIEELIAWFDLRQGAAYVSPGRMLFWGVMLSVVWPFIALRWKRKAAPGPSDARPADATPASAEIDPFTSALFGPGAILRSLVLFNLLFAVQTVLDLVYLWGGVALPHGMTYASYAHRGAYPLMLTALLAAGFVLAATRPGGPAERKPAIRILVFAWIAQNVMLVVSSILRLDLYVETYSLTSWRLAAMIWMLLVAAGLLLIVARIALDRSNRWLITANLVTLTGFLYVCVLVNFPWVISTYNVTHSREVSGKGALLDLDYLVRLGPQALPAINRYIDHQRRTNVYVGGTNPSEATAMDRRLADLVQRHRQELDSWRAWNFRGWRLSRYLDRAAQASTAPGETVDPSHSRR